MTHPPVEQGMIRLVQLKQQGRLQRGDKVETRCLGVCEVATIESFHTITVKSSDGRCFRLSGLAFGDGAQVEETVHG